MDVKKRTEKIQGQLDYTLSTKLGRKNCKVSHYKTVIKDVQRKCFEENLGDVVNLEKPSNRVK